MVNGYLAKGLAGSFAPDEEKQMNNTSSLIGATVTESEHRTKGGIFTTCLTFNNDMRLEIRRDSKKKVTEVFLHTNYFSIRPKRTGKNR